MIKVPTTSKELFPYSHFNDMGHNPLFETIFEDDYMEIVVRDLFKLKPNYQRRPRNRVDIYIPHQTAMELGEEIITQYGAGSIAVLNEIDPEQFRSGPQALPKITEARQVHHISAEMTIAGFTVAAGNGLIFMDLEDPAAIHVEMIEQEIHFGIPLSSVTGSWDPELVSKRRVPEGEKTVVGEPNPINKANGCLILKLDLENARNLATTLLHYSQTASQT